MAPALTRAYSSHCPGHRHRNQHGQTVGSPVSDPTPGNNTSAPMITTVTPQADLAITKIGPGIINAANNITYTITVTNQGPSAATSMVVTDALPVRLSPSSAPLAAARPNALGAVFLAANRQFRQRRPA